jgi:hypothetical protein
LEESLAANRARALIQMATGAGKTYAAVTQSYRLLKHAKARRILFLVDRNNLGKQAYGEFDNYVTPDDGRMFTELYNTERLSGAPMQESTKVVISDRAAPARAAVRPSHRTDLEDEAYDSGETVRRRLLQQYDVHTLLRLPTGIFYAGGVKANVLFFDKKPARPDAPWTSKLWVYDLRTGQHFTLKQNRLQREHLEDFVQRFRPGERNRREETERFRCFTYDHLIARDKVNLDIIWLKDPSLEDADSLLPPEVIAKEIVEDLEAALSEFAAIAESLQQSKAQQNRSAE